MADGEAKARHMEAMNKIFQMEIYPKEQIEAARNAGEDCHPWADSALWKKIPQKKPKRIIID